jgi:hypothetical protein
MTVRQPLYTLSIEGPMLLLTDTGRGLSITNAAEIVVAELYFLLGDEMLGKRIIYRDTDGIWDGLAHRGERFIGFVPIRETDRARAVEKALTIQDWPN